MKESGDHAGLKLFDGSLEAKGTRETVTQRQTIPKNKAVFWILATVFTPLCFSMFFSNAYIAFWYMKTGHQGPPPMPIIQKGIMYMAGFGLWLTVGFWWLIKKNRDAFPVLFQTRSNSPGKDLMWGLLLGGFWVAVYGAIGWPSFSSMFALNSAKLKSLFTSISAGVCEEFLFRGFVILVIARAGGGFRSQLIWSSLAFGLAHIFWGPIGMLFTVALGFSFAFVTLKRGNVWSAVVAHSLLNVCVEPALFEKAMSVRAG